MRRGLAALPLLAMLALAPAARAQEGGHAHQHSSGPQQMLGDYLAELEATGGDLTLRLSDAGQRPVDTAGMSAQAIAVAKDGSRKTVALKPAGENRLAGRINFVPPDDRLRAMVLLTAGAVEVGKATFNVEAAKP
jgi:hypothetical protein